MIEKIVNMPKVELHLHLDGSVSIPLLSKLSGLSEEVVKDKVVSDNANNLGEYLSCFDFVNEYLQTKENLKLASYDLKERLKKENVIYAEVRFAPISHIEGGLTFDEVVEAVLSGLSDDKIKINLILCLRRGFSFEDNIEIIKLANRYLNKGVVAVDLVGDENKYPFCDYAYFFKVCQSANIPFTIHAGEADKRDLYDVINYTKRIGHGIKAIQDDKLMQKIKDNDILLEVCPKSNIDTKNALNYSTHPIKALYDYGINVSISTDNMTVSNIDLIGEYVNLHEAFHFTLNDFKKMNIMAINHAFLTKKEKDELINIIKDYN